MAAVDRAWSSCRGRATSAARPPGSRRSRTPRTCARSPTRRSAARAKRSSPTPATSCARPRARTCSSCTTAWCARRPATSGCLLGVTRALVLELVPRARHRVSTRPPLPLDALARRRRGVPHVDRPRGAGDHRASTATRSRRARPRSPRASPPRSPPSSPATSTPDTCATRVVDASSDAKRAERQRRWTTSPAVTRVVGAVVVAHDERAVVGDVDGRRRRASSPRTCSTRTRRPSVASRAR